MHQQLWGYKVEDKLYLGVREQKRLNTTALEGLRSFDENIDLIIVSTPIGFQTVCNRARHLGNTFSNPHHPDFDLCICVSLSKIFISFSFLRF
jgi:hypothetical protein